MFAIFLIGPIIWCSLKDELDAFVRSVELWKMRSNFTNIINIRGTKEILVKIESKL
jgi:hypothetical protein